MLYATSYLFEYYVGFNTNTFTKYADRLHESQWYGLTAASQKCYVQMMTCVQRPIECRLGIGIITMNMDSFREVKNMWFLSIMFKIFLRIFNIISFYISFKIVQLIWFYYIVLKIFRMIQFIICAMWNPQNSSKTSSLLYSCSTNKQLICKESNCHE